MRKKYAHITRRGSSFAKLLEAIENISISINNSEDPRNPLLEVLLYLSIDTIKDAFYHPGGKIGEF